MHFIQLPTGNPPGDFLKYHKLLAYKDFHKETLKTRRDRMLKKDKALNKPTIAPGMDDHEELNQEASKEEISKGDFTQVTTLSYDEVDPS